MELLGVSPFEFLLILILGLVVLGPERLQSMARAAGRLVAQVLAWQQQSPEGQMVLQMRQEFEREIFQLRDEIVRTQQQFNVAEEVRRLQRDTNAVVKDTLESARAIPPPGKADKTPARSDRLSSRSVLEGADAEYRIGDPQLSQSVTATQTVPSSLLAPQIATNGSTRIVDESSSIPPTQLPSVADATDPVGDRLLAELLAQVDQSQPGASLPAQSGLSEYEQLTRRIESLSAELHALQSRLRELGVLDTTWRPPSSRRAELEVDR